MASLACAFVLQATAQTYDWRTTRQARTVVNRLVVNTNNFEREIDRARYPWNSTDVVEERLSTQIDAMQEALSTLRTSLNRPNNSPTYELEGVLTRASRINMIINRNQVSSRTTTQWNTIRRDVDTLAGYFKVAWNWNEPYPGTNYPGNGYPGGYNSALTGTYRLNTGMSDTVETVVDRSVRYYPSNQRDNVRRRLEWRLRSPDMIAIDRKGRTITMASSLQHQVTFDADGVARTETNNRGRTMTTTVSAIGNNGFSVNTTGDRMNDFNVTFATDRDGRLRATRRIYLENRNDQVTVTSVYDRVNNVADWVAVNPRYNSPTATISSGNFYIPNGVVLNATLRNALSTRGSQAGDRFTMDVISPNQYRGAVIEGRITEAERSGRLTGRAKLQMDFETITVNGRRYAFAGLIDSVRTVNGDTVSINNEGTIRDRSQTTQTVARAGIGAVLGAVIGAIAGGGEGAAIGAGVGAGAGAGTVLIGGRDNIELGSGSSFTITASAPGSTYSRK